MKQQQNGKQKTIKKA